MTAARSLTDEIEGFRVEPWLDWFGGFVAQRPRLWRRIGDLETRRLAAALEEIEIEAPIFICGLARSGSTILLECLDQHADTTSHRYRDYPGVLAPVLWDRVATRLYRNRGTLRERAHGDGIQVGADSPEAIEEMLWMAFHPTCHDPAHDGRMQAGDLAPGFAEFYRDHIRKLLWLRQGRRYLSKGNYNLPRMAALLSIFPDARFIVPVRDPVGHVASLMQQHALFSAAEARHPPALRYMQRVGHFEFGLDRRPLNLGDGGVTAEILQLWRDGRELEGTSLYWAEAHRFLVELLTGDAGLHAATLLVRHEDLIAAPAAILEQVFAHARLPAEPALIEQIAKRIRPPGRRGPALDEAAQRTVRQLTAAAAQPFGY
jgi:hypothetical protein